MYDILIAYHTLELVQESLEKIHLRFSDISCPDDFLLSESGMMKLDSIWIRSQIKNYWYNTRRFLGNM